MLMTLVPALLLALQVAQALEKIADYTPRTLVADHNALDRDQALLEDLLAEAGDDALPDAQSNSDAQRVYQEGAYSGSFARITITPPLSEDLPKGAAIMMGDQAGTALEFVGGGFDEVEFVYQVFDSNDGNHVNCIVGALPEGNFDIRMDACLPESGSITIGENEYQYSYNPSTDNLNSRTLAGFSEQAFDKLFDCGANCPYATYRKYYKYYNQYDYGHRWIAAAFEGFSTDGFENGENSFASLSQVGRQETIRRATVNLNVWMYVIREMEDALDDCEACNENVEGDCQHDGHAWDEAVAFYTGSLQADANDDNEGKLLYASANELCIPFRTCGKSGNKLTSNSLMNRQIFKQFSAGQKDLLKGQCDKARGHKEEIEAFMAVPLIQGTLYYAYQLDRFANITGEKENAAGAVFAAAVLPLLHHCAIVDAEIMSNNMRILPTSTDFLEVKQMLERNYDCMGISCQQVGGLWDNNARSYFVDAEPCGDFFINSRSGPSRGGKIALWIFGILAFIGLVFLTYWLPKRRNDRDPNFSGEEQPQQNQQVT